MLKDSLTKYKRIVLLTDGYSTPFLAKTAISLLRYRGDDIAAVLDKEHAGQTAQQLLGYGESIPVVDSLDQIDADALFIGIAPPGGKLPAQWKPIVMEALRLGMDVVSGLHDFLCNDESFVVAAHERGAKLIDVRRNNENETAKAVDFRRECLRIHAVGNDCSLGKMVTTLEIQKGLQERGCDAGFAATGQTGIMICGSGIPIDCVVSDFVNGATERLVLAHQDHDYLLIEGQGSISHPAYSAVTAGLLHGCAPDGLIFCYESGRENVKGFDHRVIPEMERIYSAYEIMSNLRHPCKIIGMAANTRHLTEEAALAEMQEMESRFGVPVCDVYRFGCDKLVDAAIQLRAEIVD
ncbi:DUF1611 domain-containing protein [Planctomycetes bacterium K23_9]|uniref:DUF1611 domain-containing protein n=1 Tax=Stieleria marina TaxID=1930275 RepID=A0A517NS49_9BACT|nr:hypothetical protein K239x_19030 [Planctomycetes bacterium K23_9]